jgi:hypothetical protein
MLFQERLKLFSICSFSKIDSAQVFEVRFNVLHDFAEQIPLFVECQEEVDSSVFW